ncbi:hypothetical protein BO86DRAFT_27122 [Aspergillus japonicus CBS 114.51]|uniref:Uncharacterized protein n=2 Tax=Aspergillus TaxID=5052 RepID=A0A2V5GXP4_ASPV1|nr:hypothetical protein BO86DRAFT_27122 [Aspergillus japonicus CBS 114.51]PYI14062.1 hypothetical protein BO99DRAFT_36002 [Aspergillus violaceofuscus CBS 115571]RAH76211.1 hypothetical protein BO86DRAFT_27122 [Aspergillus japonicus CBS 114.51]
MPPSPPPPPPSPLCSPLPVHRPRPENLVLLRKDHSTKLRHSLSFAITLSRPWPTGCSGIRFNKRRPEKKGTGKNFGSPSFRWIYWPNEPVDTFSLPPQQPIYSRKVNSMG